MRKRRGRYSRDMPRRMYLYFSGYNEPEGAPSFEKFARHIGVSLDTLYSFRKHRNFDMAFTECGEIRRDYLIDRALTRRFDPSLVKFLIEREEREEDSTEPFTVRLEVENEGL